MNSFIEKLDWDSNFFNIKICRINDVISNSNELTEALKKIKKLDIDLAYYSSPIPLIKFQNFSLLYNINLVNKKVTYSKKIIGNVSFAESVTEFKSDYPTDKLIELAIESGRYSRFNIDKKIPRSKFEELYKEWIINSVNKKLAKEVFIYQENEIIAGFVTLGEKKSRAEIGIIAVDNNYRGKGIGKSLMFAAENWFAGKKYNEIRVVTQGDNLPACRLYESCGYKTDNVEYFYHLWKKDKV